MSAHDPNADKRRILEDARAREDAREEMHVKSLAGSPEGRWLLRRLLAVFETEVGRKPGGHNSVDSYHRGRQDLAHEIRSLVIKHEGHGAVGKILKGE